MKKEELKACPKCWLKDRVTHDWTKNISHDYPVEILKCSCGYTVTTQTGCQDDVYKEWNRRTP